MVGQLGDFQWLDIHPIPILATLSKVSGVPKDIDFQCKMNRKNNRDSIR